MIIINNKPYTKDSKGFYMMPNELHYLLNELGLTAQEKLIYECLIRYSNNSENNPFPSYSTLQKFASCGRGTVSKGLKNLQELGLVDVLHHGTKQGDSNIYKIKYVYDTEAQQKALEKPKDSKVTSKKKQSEVAKIPFKRGIHADFMTTAEAEERIRYYESDEYKKQQEYEESASQKLDRILGL